MSALDRREAILAAACGFFADVGFAGTTRALADSLGVRQALLYRYFPSKDALVEAVFQRVFMQRWTRDFAAVLADRSQPLEDRLAAVYQGYAAQDDGLAMRLFLRAALDGFALPPRRGAMLTTQIFEPLVAELRHECRLPDLARVPMTPDERELVMMLHGAVMFRGMREHIYRQQMGDDAETVFRLYTRTFLTGAREALRGLHGRPALTTRPPLAGRAGASLPHR
ncbi:MAG: TetR/AcrR family transcriptional regulator [Alsobacter sp.]